MKKKKAQHFFLTSHGLVCTCNCYCILLLLLWNPSKTDTVALSASVCYNKVSFTEGVLCNKNIIRISMVYLYRNSISSRMLIY